MGFVESSQNVKYCCYENNSIGSSVARLLLSTSRRTILPCEASSLEAPSSVPSDPASKDQEVKKEKRKKKENQ